MSEEWHNDWDVFTNQLVELLDGGASDEEISEHYRGKDVRWKGEITSIGLDKQYVPGISISMSQVNKPLANNQELRTAHVALSIPEAEQDSWKCSEIGEVVNFTASIPINDKSKVLYNPEVQFFKIDGDPVVKLAMTLVNCERLGVET